MITSVDMEPPVKISISTQVESMHEKFQIKILNIARSYYVTKGCRRFENMRVTLGNNNIKKSLLKSLLILAYRMILSHPHKRLHELSSKDQAENLAYDV